MHLVCILAKAEHCNPLNPFQMAKTASIRILWHITMTILMSHHASLYLGTVEKNLDILLDDCLENAPSLRLVYSELHECFDVSSYQCRHFIDLRTHQIGKANWMCGFVTPIQQTLLPRTISILNKDAVNLTFHHFHIRYSPHFCREVHIAFEVDYFDHKKCEFKYCGYMLPWRKYVL